MTESREELKPYETRLHWRINGLPGYTKRTQTKLGPKDGNCLPACIATLLDMEVDDIPNFCADDEKNWLMNMAEWLAERGVSSVLVPNSVNSDSMLMAIGPVIASGPSSRGCLHAVVYEDGAIVHDPYPGGNGIERIDDFIALFPSPPLLDAERAKTSELKALLESTRRRLIHHGISTHEIDYVLANYSQAEEVKDAQVKST